MLQVAAPPEDHGVTMATQPLRRVINGHTVMRPQQNPGAFHQARLGLATLGDLAQRLFLFAAQPDHIFVWLHSILLPEVWSLCPESIIVGFFMKHGTSCTNRASEIRYGTVSCTSKSLRFFCDGCR